MSYEIVEARKKALGTADRFKQQYCEDGRWWTFAHSTIWKKQPEAIYHDLLEANGNLEATRAILPQGGWVSEYCMECKEYRDLVVQIQMDSDSGAATVCLPCLKHIVETLEAVERPAAAGAGETEGGVNEFTP